MFVHRRQPVEHRVGSLSAKSVSSVLRRAELAERGADDDAVRRAEVVRVEVNMRDAASE